MDRLTSFLRNRTARRDITTLLKSHHRDLRILSKDIHRISDGVLVSNATVLDHYSVRVPATIRITTKDNRRFDMMVYFSDGFAVGVDRSGMTVDEVRELLSMMTVL